MPFVYILMKNVKQSWAVYLFLLLLMLSMLLLLFFFLSFPQLLTLFLLFLLLPLLPLFLLLLLLLQYNPPISTADLSTFWYIDIFSNSGIFPSTSLLNNLAYIDLFSVHSALSTCFLVKPTNERSTQSVRIAPRTSDCLLSLCTKTTHILRSRA